MTFLGLHLSFYYGHRDLIINERDRESARCCCWWLSVACSHPTRKSQQPAPGGIFVARMARSRKVSPVGILPCVTLCCPLRTRTHMRTHARSRAQSGSGPKTAVVSLLFPPAGCGLVCWAARRRPIQAGA